MKKTVLIFLLAMVGFTAAAQKKNMEEVKFAIEVLRLALLSGDRSQLAQITTPELSYGHSSGLIENQQEFIEKLASGKSDFVTLQVTDEKITLYKDAAVVRQNWEADTNDSGTAGHLKLKVLTVWVKSKNGWQLAARQAVK
jgi:ketosteroid isomerase-like protein